MERNISTTQWKTKLDELHGESLPLMVMSFFCVQIISAAREPVIAESALPLWLLMLNGLLIFVSLVFVLWVRSGKVPARYNYPIVAVCLIMAGVKPVSFLIATLDPGPMYTAVVMLAGSLCFLSMRYLVASMTIISAAWLVAAFSLLPTGQTVASFVIVMLGMVLSAVVLRRRQVAAIGVLELEQRVSTLESILPMCASCKKTRDHTGEWKSVEEYIEDNQSGTQVSHGSCPACTEEMYGDLLKNRKSGGSAA